MTTDLHDAEARLRAALTSRAAEVEPREVDLAELERRGAAAGHALARRRTILMASAAVLVVVAVIAGVTLLGDGGEEPREPVVAGPPPASPGLPAIWPLPSMSVAYPSASEAAVSFHEQYLGLRCDRAVLTDLGVELCGTTVHVREDATHGWVVVGADSNALHFLEPAASGAAVAGRFDVRLEPVAGWRVELRPLGDLETFDTADPLSPDGTTFFDPPARFEGWLVLLATNGFTSEVVVVRWQPSGAAPTTTTEVPSTTTSTTTSATVPDDGVEGWPATADPRLLGTAEDAALAFAGDVLGFADATVTATEGAAGSVFVSLTPRPAAGATTTVRLHHTGARGWVVLDVVSDQGRIDAYEGGVTELVVNGVATAFEGTVTARVLDQDGDVLGEATGQAGSNGEQGPFEITVPITGDGVPWFVLVGEGDASGEGDLNWAAMSAIAG